jgi:hypothetical protein
MVKSLPKLMVKTSLPKLLAKKPAKTDGQKPAKTDGQKACQNWWSKSLPKLMAK